MSADTIACPNCQTELPAGFKFCGNCGHQLGAAAEPAPVVEPTPLPEPPPAPEPPSAAETPSLSRDERRDVTVMFADVSGFTAMSERLDPEAVHEIMNACFDGLGHAINEEGGHIDKYIGDNIMALFGAPVAHEDDPKRAARAALAMQAFLGEFAEKNRERTGVTFRMRIGIHCGLVLAGNVGSSVRRDYSVMGDAVNLAARLESSAEPGAILVSHEMMRRTRDQFAFGPVQSLEVKGKSGTIRAYDLTRELNELETRSSSPTSVPFVGRSDLLERLDALWTDPAGHMPWIQVSGPTGAGKTRLVEAAVQNKPELRLLKVVARPSTRHRPFALARRVIHAVLGDLSLVEDMPKTRHTFDVGLTPIAMGLDPYLSALWYLASPDEVPVPVPDPDPQTLRRTLERGMASLLANLNAFSPDIVLFLDAFENCDEASRGIFQALFDDRISPIPVIATARDDVGDVAPIGHGIEVGPLERDEAEALLARIEHARALPEDLRRDLLDRAQGIPIYIEEMLQKLLDEEVLYWSDAEGGWVCDSDATSALLPESLFGALVARIDRLEEGMRDLLLQCSVQGAEFDADVAEVIWRSRNRNGASIGADLLALEDLNLIVANAFQGNRWSFSQSLMQAACYETMLMSARKTLHRETAEAMCTVAGGVEIVSPELLAHHFEHAELWHDASAAHLRAGDRAAELFLNDDAAARYTKAIDLSAKAVDVPELAENTALRSHDGAARLHLRLGSYPTAEQHASHLLEMASRALDRGIGHRHFAAVCFNTGRTEEARRHLLHAIDTLKATEADHTPALIEALYDLTQLYHRDGKLQEAIDCLARARELQPAEDSPINIGLDLLDGQLAHTEGRFAEAVTFYERAFDAASRLGSVSGQARSSNYMGNASRDAGDYERAHAYFTQALETWERIGDTECIAGAHNNLANLAMSRGELALARHHHNLSREAFDQIGNVFGSALACTNLATLAIESDDGPEAIARAGEALAMLDGSGSAVLRALTSVVLGEGYLAAGEVAEAESTFADVLERLEDEPYPLALAAAERGLGRVALAHGRHRVALDLLQRSLDGFRQIERVQEAARTLLLVAEVHHALGDAALAHRLITDAHRQFEEIGASTDATRARALSRRFGLQDLAS